MNNFKLIDLTHKCIKIWKRATFFMQGYFLYLTSLMSTFESLCNAGIQASLLLNLVSQAFFKSTNIMKTVCNIMVIYLSHVLVWLDKNWDCQMFSNFDKNLVEFI